VSQKKKIVYIISDIDKALAFEWIADKIDHKRFSLTFILLNPASSALELYLRQKGMEVFYIPLRGKLDWVKALISTISLLRRIKPDLIHCHLLYGSIIGLTAARLAGIKTRIYTRHHSDFHFRYFRKGIKWDKWCNRLATHIIAPSHVVKEILLNFEHVPFKKIKVIHHGFDLSYFQKVPPGRVERLEEKFFINNQSPVIGVIARFTELKGIQYIIPAFKKLLNIYPDSLLLLFNAQGDYKSQIESLLTSIPDRNYRLIAFENDLAAAYQLFDVFIQASTDRMIEAFGQTYIEALASGVPSIFTLSGVAGDIIQDGQNAHVVPFRNSEAIFDKLQIILQNYERAKKMALQGTVDIADKFSLEKMICSLEELYEQG
jgi:glycosyltransferase involved in cell wall biosynthesis